jgi:murein DD-endopeptidase MepM/ murein hydrolase activator NlpD
MNLLIKKSYQTGGIVLAQKKQGTKKNKYGWDRRRIMVAIMAGFLALLMLLPIVSMIVTYAGAVTQSEINDLKKQASTLAEEKKTLQSQLTAIANDKSAAMSKKENIEQQINVVRSEISNTNALINGYQEEIDEKEVELAAAEEEQEKYYELFCDRVRSMEEDGTVSYWSILFAASSFADLLDRANFINDVIDYDNGVMEELERARQAVEDAKTALEEAKSEQEAQLAVLQDRQSELKEKEAEADALLSQIEAKEDEAQEALAAASAAATAMDSEIAKKQKELEAQLAAQKQTIVSESGYMWPLSGYYTLSSLYGGRIHPITGKANNHGGIDIPAPKNTKIMAAKSGVVITSGYNSSYGNYVVISHGNGASTLYAHMTSRAVAVGDSVKQGQTIGYVGTTGSSTGYHLHFEVRINGNRTDPINYFSSLTLYVQSNGSTVKLSH